MFVPTRKCGGCAEGARDLCIHIGYYIISRRLCFVSIKSAVYSYSLFFRYAHSPVHSYGHRIVYQLLYNLPRIFIRLCGLLLIVHFFDGILFSMTIYALIFIGGGKSVT